MRNKRAIPAIVGGALILASSLAHAFLGWPAHDAPLREASVSEDLIQSLAVGFMILGALLGAGSLAPRRPAAPGRGTGSAP